MTGLPGLYIARDGSDNGTTPVGARLAQGGLLLPVGDTALNVRTGVLQDGAGPVVTGNGDMSYNVRACRVVTLASSANGPVISANDATVNVATTAAPGSNSRIDVIWARQHLVTGDGDTDADVDFEIGVTQGTSGASPSVPAIPSGATSLAKVNVPSGTTATSGLTFTRTAAWVVANGGKPVLSSAERTAWTTAPDGQPIWNETTGVTEEFDGTDWLPVDVSDTGWLSLPTLAGAFTAQDTPGYRVKHGEVRLRGALTWTGNGGPTTAFTLPTGARPTTIRRFAAGVQTNINATIRVGTDGVVAIYTAAATGGNFIALNDVRFELD